LPDSNSTPTVGQCRDRIVPGCSADCDREDLGL
jgi:hypothetical protein